MNFLTRAQNRFNAASYYSAPIFLEGFLVNVSIFRNLVTLTQKLASIVNI